jgi:hypothetical protein
MNNKKVALNFTKRNFFNFLNRYRKRFESIGKNLGFLAHIIVIDSQKLGVGTVIRKKLISDPGSRSRVQRSTGTATQEG